MTAELKRLAIRFAGDEISELEFERSQTDLKERRQRILQSASELDPVSALAALPATREEFESRMSGFSVDRQRALLSAAFIEIKLGPVSYRGKSSFDTDRFDFQWRDGMTAR